MRYAYAETTPVLNLAAPSQIRGGWPEVGTTIAETPGYYTHTHRSADTLVMREVDKESIRDGGPLRKALNKLPGL